ncbi:MAG: acyl-CoA thioesterase [Solitalea-like symbiont of Acarus siro]
MNYTTITNETQLRVKYGDIDRMGYVYYGNYGLFLEYGRTELFRSINITYKQIEEFGYIMPVTELSIKYINPALYDQLITIKTYLNSVSNASINFTYEIFNNQNQLLTKAFTKLACINSTTNKISRLPHVLLNYILSKTKK